MREPEPAAAPELSVVVPVYNEVDSVAPLQVEIMAVLDALPGRAEIVWVDDGSRDGSLERLQELAAGEDRVRVLALDRNHGQSAALAAGFSAARGAVVVTLDADLQNDPADIPRLLEGLDAADCVNGVRIERHDTWFRRLSSRVANAVRNWVTGDTVTDVGCSLRAMRREFVVRVKPFRGMHRFIAAAALAPRSTGSTTASGSGLSISSGCAGSGAARSASRPANSPRARPP